MFKGARRGRGDKEECVGSLRLQKKAYALCEKAHPTG